MSDSLQEKLEKELKQHLGDNLPYNTVYDIHAALELSEILEAKGFSFKLKDLHPKSMYETGWHAVFAIDGKEFTAENEQPEIAVCTAAVGALKGVTP